ncbi:TetR/AcrR family transcriptional regulator [Pseudonocardia humida]|uniref:TetR/AcrR family transcriptional regulator n=1 Tax=Pseudonocardia humida TaxID=2800819 RepID=A0ABT0ZYD9_9PSEU|nr:TetR/AcrR family transcriptional regulator [Pseudonocardia humida]MCO1655747.1 TetR/AcrR family transcriptional regulator [Pseudonocardia humida]
MPTPPRHRAALVRAAAQLFRRQGYGATGLNEILAASRAPRGSLYHYFPQGKVQIGVEVVEYAGQRVTATLTELAQTEASPADVLRRYARMVVGWLEDSRFRDGSPITTVLLELAPQEAGVTEVGRAAFAAWSRILRDGLVAGGVPPGRAERLAGLALSALEGALVRARVEQDGGPVVDALDQVADLFDSALADGRPDRHH